MQSPEHFAELVNQAFGQLHDIAERLDQLGYYSGPHRSGGVAAADFSNQLVAHLLAADGSFDHAELLFLNAYYEDEEDFDARKVNRPGFLGGSVS